MFRYILMPNKTPKQRFLCNLVVFAGSAHEKENQQGLAHYLEHCVFLGTEK
jgi:zinc protease